MKSVIKCTIMLFALCSMKNTSAVIIGSNTAVSLQGLAMFPAADSDNEARGFAAFAGGIQLENSVTSCLYTSQFPMDSKLALNGGTLTLQTDLVCSSQTTIGNGGTIHGNGLAWQFTGGETVNFPIDTVDDTDLSFLTSVNAVSQINAVDWSYNGSYVLTVNTVNPTLRVYSFDGASLSLAASTNLAAAPGLSGRWHPSSYYIATGCSGGDDYEIFLFTPPSTLTKTGGTSFTGTAAAVDWHPTGAWLAGGSTGGNEFKIWPVAAGVFGTVNEFNLVTVSNRALSWRPTYTYIAVGVSTSPQLRVLSYDGTNIATNATSAIGNTVTAVDYSPTNSFIAVGLSGGTQRLQVYQHNPVAGTLTQRAALTDSNTVNSVQWSTNGNHILVGRNVGTTYELEIYEFNQNTYELSVAEFADSASNVLSARFSKDEHYIASAGYTSSTVMAIYDATQTSTERMFYLKDIHITVPSHMNIYAPMIMQGESSLYANSHPFTISSLYQAGNLISTGSLIVDSNAFLELGQLTLKGLGVSNLYCMDNTGTLELENVELIMDQDFTFAAGTLIIASDVKITGTHTFTYASSQPLIIESNATLMFDSGCTFKYAPSSSSNNLIQMEDASSELYLYETTLQLTTTALQLTKGILSIEGLCPVVSAATSQGQGLQLGDGVSANNNINLNIFPESTLAVESGYMVYKNV